MKRFLLFVAALFCAGTALAAVNINSATREQLEALNGIGPVKAQAIIDYRKENGAFKTPEDVMKVRGIKEGEFGKIKGDISVSGTSTMPTGAMKSEPPKSAAKAEPAKAMPSPARDASPGPAKADMSTKSMSNAETMRRDKDKADAAMKMEKGAKADGKADMAPAKSDKGSTMDKAAMKSDKASTMDKAAIKAEKADTKASSAATKSATADSKASSAATKSPTADSTSSAAMKSAAGEKADNKASRTATKAEARAEKAAAKAEAKGAAAKAREDAKSAKDENAKK